LRRSAVQSYKKMQEKLQSNQDKRATIFGSKELQEVKTALELTSICDLMLVDLEDDDIYFQRTFDKDVKLLILNIQTVFELISKDVEQHIEACRPLDVTADQFALYFKLKALLINYGRYIQNPEKLLRITEWFSPYILDWIDQTFAKGRAWAEEVIRIDKWTPLSETALHSSSVVDIFSICNQAYQFLANLEWPEPITQSIYTRQFVAKVSQVIKTYSDNVVSAFKNTLPKQEKKHRH